MIHMNFFSYSVIIKESNKRLITKTSLNYFTAFKTCGKLYKCLYQPNKVYLGFSRSFFSQNVNNNNKIVNKYVDTYTVCKKNELWNKNVNFNFTSKRNYIDTNWLSNNAYDVKKEKLEREKREKNVEGSDDNNNVITKKNGKSDYLKKSKGDVIESSVCENNTINSSSPRDNNTSKRKKMAKGNYLKNIHSLLFTKKMKSYLHNLKNKHNYKILMKRIKAEKNKINSILIKYQIKKGNLKINFNEHTYRKAIINTKTKIFTFLKRNRNKSLMDIYIEEKKKYILRKQKLYEIQLKLIKNSKIAQSSIKKFFKKYGYVGLTTYFVIFLMTFCCSYFFVHYKYISLSDLKYYSDKMHLSKYIDDELHKKVDSVWGELLFAYIASKISEPIRILITIMITPYIAKIIKLKKKSRIH